MATVHHPPTTGTGFGHHHEWLWLALGAILIALAASAITWAVTSQDTVSETEIASIDGFELDDDTTAIKIVSPGITTIYFGHNPDLNPDR